MKKNRLDSYSQSGLARSCGLLALSVALGACSSTKHVDDTAMTAPNAAAASAAAYNLALDGAFSEVNERLNERTIAAADSTKSQLGADFKRVKGSWRMIVFPKITSVTEKKSELYSNNEAVAAAQAEDFYDSPQEYIFKVQRNDECTKLIKNTPAGKDEQGRPMWAHQAYLNPKGEKDSKKLTDIQGMSCAILNVYRINGLQASGKHQLERRYAPARWRKDDIVDMRLYVDSNYQPRGMDVESAIGRRQSKVRRLRMDPRESLSSGLTMYPVDVPALARPSTMTAGAGYELPADPFVKNKLNKWGVATNCKTESYRFTYKDLYGNKNNVVWCKGDPWPSMISNQRFFAVLNRK